MKEIMRYAIVELTRRKARYLTNIIGYAVAVAIVIVLMSLFLFSKTANNYVLQNIGTHFIAYSPLEESNDDKSNEEDTEESFFDADKDCVVCNPIISGEPINELEGFTSSSGSIFTKLYNKVLAVEAAKIDAVRDASAFLMFKFVHDTDGHIFTVGGFDTSNTIAVYYNVGSPKNIISGRYLTPSDSGVVLVHEEYAKVKGLDIGDDVLIAEKAFNIIGIINPPLRPAEANIYMSFEDAIKVISTRLKIPLTGNEFNILLVEVKSALVQQEAMDSIKRIMNDEKNIISTYGCYIPASTVMGMGERAMLMVVLILVLAAILLAIKTQFSAVSERKHDIGVLKSIGWSNKSIMTQIIIESLMQAVCGGILGIIIAILAVNLLPINQLLEFDVPVRPGISWNTSLLVFFSTIISGMFAGMFPALKAASQKPADALRQL